MSADNFFVTIPAEKGKIALYEGSMSDEHISSDPTLREQVRQYIRENYTRCLIGLYDSREELDAAMDKYEEDQFIEYGPLFLHYD